MAATRDSRSTSVEINLVEMSVPRKCSLSRVASHYLQMELPCIYSSSPSGPKPIHQFSAAQLYLLPSSLFLRSYTLTSGGQFYHGFVQRSNG